MERIRTCYCIDTGTNIFYDKGKKRHATSLLRENAKVLAKQAGKYAEKCPDSTLFDWDSMIVYDFLHIQATEPRPVGIHLSETGEGNATFRQVRALAGTLHCHNVEVSWKRK